MKIRTKIAIGYLIMVGILLSCGWAGLHGVGMLNDTLDFLSGPAWNTADGAMEGTIEIEAQMLAAVAITQDRDSEAHEQRLNDARLGAEEALQRMVTANLMDNDQVEKLSGLTSEYDDKLKIFLTTFHSFCEARKTYETHAAEFLELGEALNVIGDGAVEEIEKSPDKPFTWNGGLAAKWEAADGGMESNIGFLWQLYYINKAIASDAPEQYEVKINEARAFQEEAAGAMLATGLFNTPIKEGPFKGQTCAKVYRQAYGRFTQLQTQLMDNLKQHVAARHEYNHVADNLLVFIGEIEETADGKVEGQTANINAVNLQIRSYSGQSLRALW